MKSLYRAIFNPTLTERSEVDGEEAICLATFLSFEPENRAISSCQTLHTVNRVYYEVSQSAVWKKTRPDIIITTNSIKMLRRNEEKY